MFYDLWYNFYIWAQLFLEFGTQVYDLCTITLADLVSLGGDMFPILSSMTDALSSIVEFFAEDMSLIDFMFGPIGITFIVYTIVLKWCFELVLKLT